MPGKENRSSQHNFFHVFVFCLILLAVVLLLINKRAEGGHQLHPPQEEPAGETAETAEAGETVVANDAPPTQDIVEPTKICQTPDGQVVVPPGDACPEDRAVADTEPEPEMVETPPPEPPAEAEAPTDLPAPTIRLGRYFTFSPELDLRADSFGCRSVFRVVSGGKSLDEIRANYQIYQDESLSLSERLAVDRSILYDYIISFDAYLNGAAVKRPGDDVTEYLDLYQECKLELTAKNTGLPRELNDGCGLSFPRSVSLLDTRGASIGPHGFRQILCTKAIISFPAGATDPDVQYFILPAAAEPAAIVVDNRGRPGVEAVLALPGSRQQAVFFRLPLVQALYQVVNLRQGVG